MKIKNKKYLITCIISIFICCFLFTTNTFAVYHTIEEKKDGLATHYVHSSWNSGLNKLDSIAGTISSQNKLQVTPTLNDDGTVSLRIKCNKLTDNEYDTTTWSSYHFALCFGVVNKYSIVQTKDGKDYNGFDASMPTHEMFAGKYAAYNYENTKPTHHTNFKNLAAVVTKEVSEINTGDAGTISCTAPGEADLNSRVTVPLKTSGNTSDYQNLCWTYPLGGGSNNSEATTANENKINSCNLDLTFTLSQTQVLNISEWQQARGYDSVTVVMCKNGYDFNGSNYILAGCGCHHHPMYDNNLADYHPISLCSGTKSRGTGRSDCRHGSNHKHVEQDFRECTVVKYWGSSTDIFNQRTLTFDFDTDTTSQITFNPPNRKSTNGTLSQEYQIGTVVETITEIDKGYHFVKLEDKKGSSDITSVDNIDKQSDNSYIITQNITLNADKKYEVITEPNNYTVSYIGNENTSGSMSDSNHIYDTPKKLKENKYKRTGYTFKKWNTQADGEGTFYGDEQEVENLTSKLNGNVNLYAIWKPNTYTVTYHPNCNTSIEIYTSSHTYDDPKKLIRNKYENPGYAFKGWSKDAPSDIVDYKNKVEVENLTAVKDGNVDLYAVWGPIEYTISYHGNGNTCSTKSPYTSTHEYGTSKALEVNKYKKTGHLHTGWKDRATLKTYKPLEKVLNLTNIDEANIDFDSIWTPITYKISYNGNGTTQTTTSKPMDSSVHTYDESKKLTKNIYVRPGYTFKEWNTKADGKGTSYEDEQEVKNLCDTQDEELKLYAIWEPNMYKIVYKYNAPKDVNGSSRESQIVHKNQPSSAAYDDWFKVNNPTLKGYIFTGWKLTNLSANIYKYVGTSTTSYITIDKNKINYSYQCGGKNAAGAARYYKNLNLGEDPNIDSSKWPTVVFDVINPNGDLGWEPIQYDLILDGNKGTFDNKSSSTIKLKYDQKYKLPIPIREGYQFIGWQIYEVTGESDYKDLANKNTNPLTADNVSKFNGGAEVYNLCYGGNSPSIKLVAIWNHDHADPTFNSLELDATNEYIYKDNVDPTDFAEYSYYINTNQINDITFDTNITVQSSPKWYNLDSYQLVLKTAVTQKDIFTASPVSQKEYTISQAGAFEGITKTKDNFKIHIEGNAYKTCIPEVTMKCTWDDNYTKCNCKQEDLIYTGIPVTIIGDCEIPTIKNLNKLTDLTAIDLEEVYSYEVALTGQDDAYIQDPSHTSTYPSGLIELCYFKISNLDNHKKANAGTGLAKKNYRKYNLLFNSDGLIYHVDFESFDLANYDFLTQADYDDIADLFIGDLEFEYYLRDNVGNVFTNTDITSVFDMDIDLESFTYTPTNFEEATITTHIEGTNIDDIPVFKKGESAILSVNTTGFVDGLRIEFPENWYINEKYPLYMYWGDSSTYTDKSLEPITSHVFYLNTEDFSDDLGYWAQDFIFVLPLYADKTNLSQITVTAYKGATNINDQDILINHEAGPQLENLSCTAHFKVTDESILDDYRDSIQHTY